MHDCLVIGGGVIGLSLAYDLARHGARVQIIDRGELGREASWAGAGILPPASSALAAHPYEQLAALSHELQPLWSARLREETGIDDGYRRCGGIYVARRIGEAAALRSAMGVMREEQIRVEEFSPPALAAHEPALATVAQSGQLRAAFLLPDEAQVRNPRRLRALVEACRRLGVTLSPEVELRELQAGAAHAITAITSQGELKAGMCCVAAGAWTSALLAQLGISVRIVPIRGQMLLYRCESRPFTSILNEGSRYLVPRDDGRVLAGSTEEDVGFDKRTTEAGLAELRQFAEELVPALADAEIENSWAGLRPGSLDRFPYLGRLPGFSNLFIAAGHYRSGLHLSPATAEELSRLMRGEPTRIDLSPFQPGR